MNPTSKAHYLKVQALVRKWRDFACNGEGLIIDESYQAGEGKILEYISDALCDREENLFFQIILEDGQVENLPNDISFECEVDGASEYTLTDLGNNVLATWPGYQGKEVPSALLAPSENEPERWVIDIKVEGGKILGWPISEKRDRELCFFTPNWEPSDEIGIPSL